LLCPPVVRMCPLLAAKIMGVEFVVRAKVITHPLAVTPPLRFAHYGRVNIAM
jgi:hypothetical protein